MFYYLDVKNQIRNIFQRKELFKRPTVSTDGKIRDVTDGFIYRKIFDSKHDEDLRNGKAFTFLMNTDGISASDSSNLTIWLVLNLKTKHLLCAKK